MKYKKIALCFLFFSGQAFCMLVNPVRETWNDQFFTQKSIPKVLSIIMNHLDFNSNAYLLMTCKHLNGTYKDKGFALSPEAYMQEMIRASRSGNREQVKLLIKREAAAHKRQRESLLDYFNVAYYNLAALMGIYKREYGSECTNFMRLQTEIKFGDLAIKPVLCRLLLEQGISPNIDYMGDTLLIRVVKGGNSEVVKFLLKDERTDPNKENKKGSTPLLVAIEEGDSEVIKFLLDHKKIEPNKGDNKAYMPLHLAVSRGNLEAIKLLLDHEEIEPNNENKNCHTPLHYAVDKNLEAATELLLRHKKIEPNKGNIDGCTPLHWAIRKKRNLKLIQCLLRHAEIDLNKKDNTGQTPFHHAIASQNSGAIKLLLDHEKFEPDQKHPNGETSLFYAANNRAPNAATLRQLLGISKDTNLFWYNFHHYVSCNKQFDMLPLLSECTSYKARFFYGCGYITGFLRRKILGWEAGTKGAIVDVVITTSLSAAAIAFVVFCCAAKSSSSKEKSENNKNKNPYSRGGVGQFESKMSWSTNPRKF